MIRVPGQGPVVPWKKVEETTPEIRKPMPAPKEGNKGPDFDARSIAVRMAALAVEAKEKELSFEEIIQRAIDETGMTNPEAAVEEASRKLHKEIEDEIEMIKSNKELMDEADAWKTFSEILESELSQDQISDFLGAIKESIKGL